MIIKVCGMRDAHNIREVETLKPTMMGFICWDGSPRCIMDTPSYLPKCIRVGVFVDPELSYVRTKVNQLRLDRIQLHGHETPEMCQNIIMATGRPIIKAISIRTAEDVQKYRPYEGIADLLLFDTKCKTIGGSGESFNWEIIEQHYDGDIPFLLAGGIGPQDVEAVRQFRHPRFLGIDINSRFEIAKGVKDYNALHTFIKQLRA